MEGRMFLCTFASKQMTFNSIPFIDRPGCNVYYAKAFSFKLILLFFIISTFDLNVLIGNLYISILQLAKLLELREANHIEFRRIKDVLDEILQMYRNNELLQILKLLIDPTWAATGLKVDFDSLVRFGASAVPLSPPK